MSFSFLFWFLMLLWLLSYWWGNWGPGTGQAYWPRAHWGLLFVLFALVGWRVFGFPIQG